MSFATDLLDGFELLYKRTEGGLKSATELATFFQGLAKCERQYAKHLLKLSATHTSTIQKAPAPSQKEVGTTYACWETTVGEIVKIAEHHKQFADKLDNDIISPVLKYVKDQQTQKKKLETEGQKLTKDMKAAHENLQKARAKYVQCSRDADSAEAVHTKGKGDMNMKPSALAKLAAKASSASDKAQQADSEYQASLSATNQKQTEYYTQTMPALLNEFQQFEQERLQFQKEMTEKFASLFSEKPSFYTTICETITAAAQSISVESDIITFVEENKTNVTVPPDIQYVPYDTEVPAAPPKASKPPKVKGNPPSKIGKYKGAGEGQDFLSSKDWGLTAGDQGLPLEEQKAKLAGQVEELQKAQVSETKTKEGLENLFRFYASDPVAQKKAEDELIESEQKLQRIAETLATVQSQLDALKGGRQAQYAPASNSGTIKVRGLFDYTATCDTELSFKEGEILTISEQDDSGWWYAEVDGRSGFIPNNYVERV